jgi:hypothetical protein
MDEIQFFMLKENKIVLNKMSLESCFKKQRTELDKYELFAGLHFDVNCNKLHSMH